MRRKSSIVVVLTATGLLAAGCGGSSGEQHAAQSALHTSESAAATAPSALTTPSGRPSSGGPIAPGAKPTAKGQTSASTQQRSAQRQGSQPTQQSPALPPLTKPGHYTYATSGSTKSPFGAKDANGTATLTVDAPSGHQQHQTLSSPDLTQEQTLLTQPGGYYLVALKISTQGFTEEFRAATPVLFAPRDAPSGKTWSWQMKSTDGKYTIDTTSKIVGTAKQKTTSGASLDTVVLSSQIKVTGNAVQMASTQDDWLSPAYALIVKEHAVMHGTGYGQTFDSDITRTLESPAPK